MSEVMTDLIDLDQIDEQIEEELAANVTLAIQTSLLKGLVNKVKKTVAKHAVLDVYKTIYFGIEEGQLTLRAINSDLMMEARAVVDEGETNFKITKGHSAEVCFPGAKLPEIVDKLTAKTTEITIKGTEAKIKSGRAKFQINVLEGEQFPRVPELGDSDCSVTVPVDVLTHLYFHTSYAASTSETRPILTGVNHFIEEGLFKCRTTDSFRMAQYTFELNDKLANLNATVPADIIKEAMAQLRQSEGDVTLRFHQNQLVYEFENATMYARLIEGNFPDLNRLIFPNANAASTVTVNAGAFKQLLASSTVYNPDQPIIISIKPELNQMRVNTKEEQVGAFQQDISTTHGKGPDIALAVNVRYLQAAMDRYDSNDSYTFYFVGSTETKPAGTSPFKGMLHNGDEDCVELFVPVRSAQVKYGEPIVLENFQGAQEFEFDAFEADFKAVIE